MSKKTFRKGVALATGLSFGLVGLTAMPATADSTGRVTLEPTSGKTFNSLITDGFNFVTEIDDDLSVNDKYLTYKVENAGKKSLSFDATMTYSYKSDPYFVADCDDSTEGNQPCTAYDEDQNVLTGADAFDVMVMKNGVLEPADADHVVEQEGDDLYYYDDAVLYIQVEDTYEDSWINAEYGADYQADAQFAGSEYPSYFSIFTDEDSSDVNLKVTSWLNRNEGDANGAIDADELQFATDAEAVTLYDPKNITGAVILNALDLEYGRSTVEFTVKLNNDINVGQITAEDFAAQFYENGTPLDLDGEGSFDANDVDSPLGDHDGLYLASNTTTNLLEGTFDFTVDHGTGAGENGVVGNDNTLGVASYSARAAWIAEAAAEDDYWVTPRTASFAVAKGTNRDVVALAISAADTKNALQDTDVDFDLRSGTKAVTYNVQAIQAEGLELSDDLSALKASNVRVRVTLDLTVDVDGSALSISGSSETLKSSDDEDIVVFGRTDANGKFSFTVTSAAAVDGEQYDVDVEFLGEDGTWAPDLVNAKLVTDGLAENDNIESGDIDADYVDAYIDAFDFSNDILAGSTVKAVLTVEDQFGEAISTLDGDALKVFLTDSEDFEKSANVSGGKAEFSFTNWLTKGDIATLEASLYTGSDETDLVDVETSDNPIEATLYNPEATGAVIVDAEADINITQEAFIVGEEDADADIVAPSENELLYEGIVEDANGAGLPAAVVTIKGAGLQFEEITDADADPVVGAGEWFKDSITVVADETGYFAVNVWAHKVGETVITVTSGGKSDTTTLTAAFGALTENDVKISWNAPKHPAINGLYAVTIKVTDLWGNAIEGADVEINTDGALQVNGDDFKEKTTNAAGKATVYVGGVKDMKGFGGITADVTRVYIDVAGNDVDDDEDGEIEANEIDLVDTLLSSGDLADGDYTSVTQEVLVGVSASAAAGKNAGVVIAKAWNTKGKTLQVYVGGKLKATRTTVSGVDTVKLTGIKTGSKLVTIKVGGSTYFSGYVTVK